MAAGTFLRLLIVLFCFSHIICIKAVPITRTRSLTHEYQVHRLPKNNHLAKLKKSFEVHQVIGRMDVELNDYPGPGANNRHTPKPPPWRGCTDC